MKLILSSMSGNRRVGKALLRLRPDLERLEEAFAAVDVANPRYQNVKLWLSDNAPDYYHEDPDDAGALNLILVGIDERLSFQPTDDDELRRFWVGQVEHFVRSANLTETVKERLLAACADWRTERRLV